MVACRWAERVYRLPGRPNFRDGAPAKRRVFRDRLDVVDVVARSLSRCAIECHNRCDGPSSHSTRAVGACRGAWGPRRRGLARRVRRGGNSTGAATSRVGRDGARRRILSRATCRAIGVGEASGSARDSGVRVVCEAPLAIPRWPTRLLRDVGTLIHAVWSYRSRAASARRTGSTRAEAVIGSPPVADS
jgi:hypothetical protein